MSGDDPPPRERRGGRRDRTDRSNDAEDDRGDEGGSSRTRPEPPAGDDSGSSGMIDDAPVSKSVLGGFATVLVLYVVLGLFLAVLGNVTLNLFGNRLVRRLGTGGGDIVLGYPTVAFYGIVGPVLALPLGLWTGDRADSLLAAAPAAAVANGAGHFVMALLGAVLLAWEFNGLQVVHLVVPYLFAAVFAAILAGGAAAASAYLS